MSDFGDERFFDDSGNLLTTGEMTNTWNAANRLVGVNRDSYTLQPIYNGLGDRVGQTVGVTTTHFALDVQGLPEVIYSSDGNAFLHLPGVIVTESTEGEQRYLLSDGLGSVRQVTDEDAEVIAYYEFGPYGNPVENVGGEPYGYTGEWFESYIDLLFLRARWYAPETGTFLSVDPVGSEPPYAYVGGNPVNRVDPSGLFPLDVIMNSLGRGAIQAFARGEFGRGGLLELLIDAKEGDIITPLVVDFDRTGSEKYVRYPLRISSGYGTQPAVITCNGNELEFFNPGMNLFSYLLFLNAAADVEKTHNLFKWRDDTVELHYYQLQSKGVKQYYDDFGGKTLLPDARGWAISVDFKAGGQVTHLVDRFGQTYLGASVGIGIGFTGAVLEGYTKNSVWLDKQQLAKAVSGASISVSVSVPDIKEILRQRTFGQGWGGSSTAFTNFPEEVRFAWYMTGATLGGSIDAGYTIGPIRELPEESWKWIDGVDGESKSYRMPDFIGSAPNSGNECSACNSP